MVLLAAKCKHKLQMVLTLNKDIKYMYMALTVMQKKASLLKDNAPLIIQQISKGGQYEA